MAAMQSGDETIGGGNESKTINRRKALKAVGIAGASSTWLGNTVAAMKEQVEEQGLEVHTLSGKARTDAIRDAQSDRTYQKISTALSAEGFRPKKQNSITKRTTYTDQDSHRTVVIPFTKQGGNATSESAHILWVDRNFGTHSVLGFRFERSPDSTSTTASTSADYSERYFVKDGEVRTKESNYHTLGGEDVGTQDYLPPVGGGDGCGDLCAGSATVCDSYNYDCWSSIAGAYGSSMIICGECVASFFDDALCGACIFAVLSAYGVDCDLGNGCETVTGCYECNEYPNVT